MLSVQPLLGHSQGSHALSSSRHAHWLHDNLIFLCQYSHRHFSTRVGADWWEEIFSESVGYSYIWLLLFSVIFIEHTIVRACVHKAMVAT